MNDLSVDFGFEITRNDNEAGILPCIEMSSYKTVFSPCPRGSYFEEAVGTSHQICDLCTLKRLTNSINKLKSDSLTIMMCKGFPYRLHLVVRADDSLS